jgi:hypothetical protein
MSFELADLFDDIRNSGRAVLHVARILSYSGFMRPAFAVMGLAVLVGCALIVLYNLRLVNIRNKRKVNESVSKHAQ